MNAMGGLQLWRYSKAVKLWNEDSYQQPIKLSLCLQIWGFSFSVTAPDGKHLAIERQTEIRCSVAGPFGRFTTSNWLPRLFFYPLKLSHVCPLSAIPQALSCSPHCLSARLRHSLLVPSNPLASFQPKFLSFPQWELFNRFSLFLK